jgi:hypothetical protein
MKLLTEYLEHAATIRNCEPVFRSRRKHTESSPQTARRNTVFRPRVRWMRSPEQEQRCPIWRTSIILPWDESAFNDNPPSPRCRPFNSTGVGKKAAFSEQMVDLEGVHNVSYTAGSPVSISVATTVTWISLLFSRPKSTSAFRRSRSDAGHRGCGT